MGNDEICKKCGEEKWVNWMNCSRCCKQLIRASNHDLKIYRAKHKAYKARLKELKAIEDKQKLDSNIF